MAKEDVNAVRQVLMNELGLTRESVREVMMKIVDTTVEKHLTRLTKDGTIERIIGAELRKQYHSKKDRWSESLTEQISSAVRRAADAFVKRNVCITNICNAEKPETEEASEKRRDGHV